MSAATPAGAVQIAFQPELSAVESALAELRKGYDIPLRGKWIGPNGEPSPEAASAPQSVAFTSARDVYAGPGGNASFTNPGGAVITNTGAAFVPGFETPADRAAPKSVGPVAPQVNPSRAVADLGMAIAAAEEKTISMKEAAIGPLGKFSSHEEKAIARDGISNTAAGQFGIPPALTAAAEKMLHAAEQMSQAATAQERSAQQRIASADRADKVRQPADIPRPSQRAAAKALGISDAEATALGIPAAESEAAAIAVPAAAAVATTRSQRFMIPRGPRSVAAMLGRSATGALGGFGAFGAAFAGYEVYSGVEGLSETYNRRRMGQLRGQTQFQQAGQIATEAGEIRGSLVGRSMEAIGDLLGRNAPEILTRPRTTEAYYSGIERAGGERDFLHASRRENYLATRGIKEAEEVNPFRRERLNIQTQSAEASLSIGERYNAELLKYNDTNDPGGKMRGQLEDERRGAIAKNNDLYNARIAGQQRDETAGYNAQYFTAAGGIRARQAALRGDIRGQFEAEASGRFRAFQSTEAQKFDLTTEAGRRARDVAVADIASDVNTRYELARRQEESQRISITGENETLRLQIGRRPLEAQLAGIRARTQADLATEPREEFRQQITEAGRQQQELARQQFRDRERQVEFSLGASTLHFNTLAGITPEARGQSRGTRTYLDQVNEIISGAEERRRGLIEQFGGDEAKSRGLLHANVTESRSRLSALRQQLSEGSTASEGTPAELLSGAFGIQNFNADLIQKKIRRAFGDVGNESSDIPGDKKPGGDLSGDKSSQQLTTIQSNSTISTQAVQQILQILLKLNPVIA